MDDTIFLRLRRLSDVPRWTVVPTIRPQNVAEHSFHVASLALWLGPRHAAVAQGSISMGDVLTAALCHDEFESVSGDIPSPVKKLVCTLPLEEKISAFSATGEIKRIIKICDLLEALVFLKEETHMGNCRIDEIFDYVYSILEPEWVLFEWAPTYGRKPSCHELMSRISNLLDYTAHPVSRACED